jgi:hypothetical protein
MLMFDSHTSTLWSQLLGIGNAGTLTDTVLLRLPAQIVSFEAFTEAFPDAPILSRDTGFSRSYGQNPYIGYDAIDSSPFLFRGAADGRLAPMTRVVSVDYADTAVAYPFEVLERERATHDDIADLPIVVFWQPGTASALDGPTIANSRDVGAVGAFDRRVNGEALTFHWQDGSVVDHQTGSTWNILGQAVAGELAGQALTPVVHDNTLWFAWAAFKPETRVVTGE